MEENNFDISKVPTTSGVYMIKNILNNHKYIGSTKNFKQRLKQHLSDLRRNKHHSYHLQAAWSKYGEKHFIFQILETCEPIKNTLMFLEQKYLDLKPEYNISPVAYSCLGRKFSKEKRREITEKRLKSGFIEKVNKPVLQYDLNCNLIARYPSIKAAAEAIGTGKQTSITACCQGKFTHSGGYIWKYENDMTPVKRKYPAYFKKVIQKDKFGNILNVYNSTTEAADHLLQTELKNRSRKTVSAGISLCARGLNKTAYNYKWEYGN